MKKFAIFILCLAAVLSAAWAQERAADIYSRPAHFEPSRDFDVLHYRIVCNLDEKVKTMRAEAAVTLSAFKDGLTRIILDADQFKVEDVRGPDGKSLPFEMGGGRLAAILARPLPFGQAATITIRYLLENPKRGMRFIDARPGVPAQAATYNWPEEGRFWFPCFDSPNDKATSEFIVTVPGRWKALSNGRLVEETADMTAGTRTFHWLQDKPHPTYNVMLVAGPFAIVTDKLGELPVNYWVYEDRVADAPRSFQKTPRMIAFFETTFGHPYPWAKYDQICTAGTGGGMEATSATMLGDDTLHDARADQDFPSGGLVSHELAHQWWGDLVTERHWTDVWLSESFATYAEHLWSRFDLGEDEGALNLLEKKNEYLREAKMQYTRPLVFNRFNNPWDVMDSHSYPKGAVILHMLRDLLGDKPFFGSLSLFLKRFEFQSADTHDFMNAVKDAAGVNLDWFFEQWIYGAGHPVFEVSWTWDEAARAVRLKVAQMQRGTGIPEAYRLPARIGIVSGGGVRIERIDVTKREETFSIAAETRPLSVRFDEGHFLLKEVVFDKPTAEVLVDLNTGDAVTRIEATGRLASRTNEPGVTAALQKTAEKDPFWAVRRGALEALAALPAAGLTEFYKSRALDPSSNVRAAAIRALGETKDKRLASFFIKRFGVDDSYMAQAACLAALGKCGDAKAGDFLRKAAALPSPRRVLNRGALAALKALGLEASVSK